MNPFSPQGGGKCRLFYWTQLDITWVWGDDWVDMVLILLISLYSELYASYEHATKYLRYPRSCLTFFRLSNFFLNVIFPFLAFWSTDMLILGLGMLIWGFWAKYSKFGNFVKLQIIRWSSGNILVTFCYRKHTHWNPTTLDRDILYKSHGYNHHS